ncbi:MAG TPA: D-alanyl-D-alanine carboxypeptidase [Acholeplasmataceae bacterium]|nr:D-alanyl-D-alanine carboxypeptidase [Acholeplasmataceae bacterium]
MKILLFFFIFFGVVHVDSNIYVHGESAIVMESNSNRILFEKNIHDVHLTASIAKIMTAIVAIENGDLDKYCTVDTETISQIGSSIYLELGDKVKLIDLIYGLMLRSGNDAAYLIAKSVSGSVDKFVEEMNNKAKQLKMTSSVFNNPSGLDDENYNYSTAYDMAILMSHALDNNLFRKITATKTYRFKTMNDKLYVLVNKHRLVLNNKYTIGGKTGYTKLARRTLVTAFSKYGLELIVVTFNCGNDFNLHQELSEYYFEKLDKVKVFSRGIINIPMYEYTPVVYQEISYPVLKDEKLTCEIHLLRKPKEEVIGRIYLKINNEVVKTFNVYRYY